MSNVKYVVLCIGAAIVLHSNPGRAQNIEWFQDNSLSGFVGGPGCATQIAVGPNGVPWVMGCNGPNGIDRYVYYLKFSPCTGECFGGSYQWTYANGAVSQISVDLEGAVWGVTSDGEIWKADFAFSSGVALPDGVWVNMTTSPTEEFPNTTWPGFGVGRLKSVVVIDSNPIADETFDTQTGFFTIPHAPFKFWGLGYDTPTNKRIFSYDEAVGVSTWSQMDPQDGADGTRIALFSSSSPITGVTQTPWLINSAGTIYSYSFASGSFKQMPGAEALDITDHFVVSYPYIFQWSDSLLPNPNWVNVGTELTPAESLVIRIAHAPAITAMGQNIGPSMLWGLDSVGRIFYATNSNIPR